MFHLLSVLPSPSYLCPVMPGTLCAPLPHYPHSTRFPSIIGSLYASHSLPLTPNARVLCVSSIPLLPPLRISASTLTHSIPHLLGSCFPHLHSPPSIPLWVPGLLPHFQPPTPPAPSRSFIPPSLWPLLLPPHSISGSPFLPPLCCSRSHKPSL